jgi:hypothetical protein
MNVKADRARAPRPPVVRFGHVIVLAGLASPLLTVVAMKIGQALLTSTDVLARRAK